MSHNKKETENTFFSGVGLYNPKNGFNIGGSIRAAAAFNSSFLVSSGVRHKEFKTDFRNMDADLGRKRIPCFIGVDSLLPFIPYDTVPVAIERSDDGVSLPNFQHPRRAFYIFGPEDGAISDDILNVCHHKVYIPSSSLNLQVCVHLVLYDRFVKAEKSKEEAYPKCPDCGSDHCKIVENPPVFSDNGWMHCNACNFEGDTSTFIN